MSEPTSWVRQAAIAQLESLRRAGVLELAHKAPATTKRPSYTAAECAAPAANDSRAEPAHKPIAHTDKHVAATVRSIDADLSVIQREVAACTACSELASTRTQTVFGVGNPHARLVFLGEAPGADEDKQGEPFVGRAGQLLNDIIKAMTLRREDVYILNILKCRPPGNRNPAPDEAANCRGFLDRQLALIEPEFICCLGAVAAQNLLQTKTPIGRLRGSFHDYRGIRVLCTYHPAYLLRDPSKKGETWTDMKLLMAAMGIELPKKT